MEQRVFRSRGVPERVGASYDERWTGSDRGLITCWEVGRRLSKEKPGLAKRARNGELPPLGWKGGVERDTKNKKKYGTHLYLAQWQGLRGEDLDIDMSTETELVCSKTGVKVTYTGDVKKYGIA